jgi:protein gp37
VGIKTDIGWCDSSVNELVGCDGCELHCKGKPESHCYAAVLVGRYAGLPGWPPAFDTPTVIPGRLAKAIKWPDLTGKDRPEKPWLNGYPRIVFVSDLSDPFTESVDPDSWLTPALPAMADSPHVYILLTKRGRRMLSYWQRHAIPGNVWQGVTVTGPDTVKRLDCLLQVPGAAVRFASLEPLLAEVDLKLHVEFEECGGGHRTRSTRLDWVIVGGESGARARPMHPDAARLARDQCHAANVAYFFKQWGEWAPKQRFSNFVDWNAAAAHALVYQDGRFDQVPGRDMPDMEFGLTCADLDGNDYAAAMARVGVKRAGRVLDGAVWSGMPRLAA